MRHSGAIYACIPVYIYNVVSLIYSSSFFFRHSFVTNPLSIVLFLLRYITCNIHVYHLYHIILRSINNTTYYFIQNPTDSTLRSAIIDIVINYVIDTITHSSMFYHRYAHVLQYATCTYAPMRSIPQKYTFQTEYAVPRLNFCVL